MSARVALATARGIEALDPDDRPLLPALAARGVEAEPAVWDDPTVAWEAFALVVLRSTWDYAPRRAEFLRWSAHVAEVSRLANPPEVVRWNTDKRYLGELAQAGVPVVPTTFVEPGQPFELPRTGEYVVKPAVSAGAKDTARYGAGDAGAATAHVRALLDAGRVVLVQPYLGSVDRRGETALLHLGGALTHAIRKGPLLRRGAAMPEGLFAEEDIRPRDASPAERSLAAQVMGSLPFPPEDLLYARVDLLEAGDGAPVLLELELTEPSLFLGTAAGAVDRFADAIAARV